MTTLPIICLTMTILSLFGLFAFITISERHEGLAQAGCAISPVIFIVSLVAFGASLH
jgi:hypothetical protein